MRALFRRAVEALGMGKTQPPVWQDIPLTAPVSAATSCPADFPAPPPHACAPQPMHFPPLLDPQLNLWPPAPQAELPTWPAQPGIATYADTEPGAVVWFPHWPAPTRIEVPSGGDAV